MEHIVSVEFSSVLPGKLPQWYQWFIARDVNNSLPYGNNTICKRNLYSHFSHSFNRIKWVIFPLKYHWIICAEEKLKTATAHFWSFHLHFPLFCRLCFMSEKKSILLLIFENLFIIFLYCCYEQIFIKLLFFKTILCIFFKLLSIWYNLSITSENCKNCISVVWFVSAIKITYELYIILICSTNWNKMEIIMLFVSIILLVYI